MNIIKKLINRVKSIWLYIHLRYLIFKLDREINKKKENKINSNEIV